MNTPQEFLESLPKDTMKRLLYTIAYTKNHPMIKFIGSTNSNTDSIDFSAESDDFKNRVFIIKGDA